MRNEKSGRDDELGCGARLLGPTDEAGIEAYREVLGEAIGSPKVHNIGLVGPKGSGKTSLLKTYEKTEKGKNGFVFITLGTLLRPTKDKRLVPPMLLMLLMTMPLQAFRGR
jgi:hypothetical protein